MEKFYSNNERRNFFITCIIILTLISLTLVYVFFYNNEEHNIVNNDQKDVTDEFRHDNNNIVKQGPLNEKHDNSYGSDKNEFSFTINKDIIFKDVKSFGNIKIENPAFNQYNFYVEIKLKGQDEIIYKSPILKPDQHIEGDYLNLNLNLKKGAYDAIATIFVVDVETEELITKSDVNVNIKIKQ